MRGVYTTICLQVNIYEHVRYLILKSFTCIWTSNRFLDFTGSGAPFKHGFNSIQALLCKYIQYKVLGEIPYPFPNSNGTTIVKSLGIDECFQQTLRWAYRYISLLGLNKLIFTAKPSYVVNKGPESGEATHGLNHYYCDYSSANNILFFLVGAQCWVMLTHKDVPLLVYLPTHALATPASQKQNYHLHEDD